MRARAVCLGGKLPAGSYPRRVSTRGAGAKPRTAASRQAERRRVRVRRIAALVAVLLVAGIVWWFSVTVSEAYRAALVATPEPHATGTPVTLPDGVTGQAPSASPKRSCTAADISVTAFSDAPRYAAEAQPSFWLTLANRSATPCVMNIGTAVQLYTVTSDGQTVWASEHCQRGASDELVELAAGQELTAPPITWVREHSAPETCEQQRPAAAAAGTSYELTVAVNGVISAPVSFVLD